MRLGSFGVAVSSKRSTIGSAFDPIAKKAHNNMTIILRNGIKYRLQKLMVYS